MNPGEEGTLTAPWRRVFLGITAFLLVFLLFLAYLIYGGGDREQEWFERAQRHASLRTDRNALAFLNEAFEKTDWKALEKNSDALRRIGLRGSLHDAARGTDHPPVRWQDHQRGGPDRSGGHDGGRVDLPVHHGGRCQ